MRHNEISILPKHRSFVRKAQAVDWLFIFGIASAKVVSVRQS
jgi:hypothetical protein